MPTRLAAVLCAAGLSAMAGCAPLPARQQTATLTINLTGSYRAPMGAVPAALTAQPVEHDFSGVPRIVVDGASVSPFEALDRIHDQYALIVGQVGPVPNPVAVRVHIVVPDHDRLRLLALRPGRNVANGVIEFGAELRRLDLHQVADAVVHSQAFAGADVAEENDTVWPDAAGADDVLWYQVQSVRPNNAGPWAGSWQMRRANGSAPLAVSLDPGTAIGPARLMSFVRSAQEAAATLAGTPASAFGPPRARRPGHAFSGGSGIVVDEAGDVLTDNHVIANCADVRVTFAAGGTPVGATLVANDAKLDLALLRTGEPARAYARFRDSRTLRPGEPLVATGFPLSGLVSPEMAVTTGSLTALSGLQGNPHLFQFSAPVQAGNSGGPVLDASGRVAGITTAVLNGLAVAAAIGGPMPQNVNFATKADVARDYLAGIDVRLDERVGRPTALDPASVADLARRFTSKVECWR